jgi:hypothetical protein
MQLVVLSANVPPNPLPGEEYRLGDTASNLSPDDYELQLSRPNRVVPWESSPCRVGKMLYPDSTGSYTLVAGSAVRIDRVDHREA